MTVSRAAPSEILEYTGEQAGITDEKFLVPVCATRTELLYMLSACYEYAIRQGPAYDPRVFTPLVQAMYYIDNPFASPCVPSADNCIEYSARASMVEYLPAPPFGTPPGYARSPWYVASGTFVDDLQGVATGDVLTDIGRLPTGTIFGLLELLGQGTILPAFNVRVSGTGTVELHFRALPLGGRALISLDNPIDIGDFIAEIFNIGDGIITSDLQRDITQFPIETDSAEIVEIEITEPGDHIIYVNMFPVVDDSLTSFLRFGGGLTKVVLCGTLCPTGVECRDEEGRQIMTADMVTEGLRNFYCGCGCGDGDGSGGAGGTPDPTTPEGQATLAAQRVASIYRVMAEFNKATEIIYDVYDPNASIADNATFIASIYEADELFITELDAALTFSHAFDPNAPVGPFQIESVFADAIGETYYCNSLGYRSTLILEARRLGGAAGEWFENYFRIFTNERYERWAQLAIDAGIVRDDYLAYACYIRQPETLFIDSVGDIGTQSINADGRSFRMVASGRYALDGGGFADALYTINASGQPTFNPIAVGLRSTTTVTTPQVSLEPSSVEKPPYNPTGEYVWTSENGTTTPVFYSGIDNRGLVYVDAAPVYEVTFIDQGEAL